MERLTFDGLFCDIAKCDNTPGGTFCESGTCTLRKVWERLKEYEDAEQDGRLSILPKSQDGTCGSCGHFNRIPGKRRGTCEVRSNYTDRWGRIDARRGTFTPSQSRKCCKQYIPREEAEAALAGKGGEDHRENRSD